MALIAAAVAGMHRCARELASSFYEGLQRQHLPSELGEVEPPPGWVELDPVSLHVQRPEDDGDR